jgi:hypothetical protein
VVCFRGDAGHGKHTLSPAPLTFSFAGWYEPAGVRPLAEAASAANCASGT